MRKATEKPAAPDDELSPGAKAGVRRRANRTPKELRKQADTLRDFAISLDQYVDELDAKKIRSFEMDGVTKFDRAETLLRDYLVQVNRWIGAAQHW